MMKTASKSKSAPPTKRPSLVAPIHDAYPISNLEASLRFYTEVLGLELLPRPDMPFPGAWLTDDSGRIEIHLFVSDQPKPGAAAKPSNLARHAAYVVDDLDAWREHLREHGVEFMDRNALIGRPQVFVTDPDGHTIEFQQAPISPD